MSNKILVTDSLFIFDEHIKQLEEVGFEVERLDKPDASEEELCEVIKGKVGYILGGIEKVTDKIIDAADELKVIVFTGADYKFFIPGWQRAVERGIAIANAPGSNRYAVSEFAVSMALAMQRNMFELGRTGTKSFETTGSFKNATIGIVGMGRIGQRVAEILPVFGPSRVLYYNRSKKQTAAELVSFDELIAASDIIFVLVPSDAGQLFAGDATKKIKPGALIVNMSDINLFNLESLLARLQADDLRMFIDQPAPSDAFLQLPLHTWFNTNGHTAYNTHEANQVASDRSVISIINLLTTGTDENKVA